MNLMVINKITNKQTNQEQELPQIGQYRCGGESCGLAMSVLGTRDSVLLPIRCILCTIAPADNQEVVFNTT